MELIKGIARAIASLFGGADPKAGDKLSSSLDNVEKSLGPLGSALESVRNGLRKFFDFLQPILEKVKDVFGKIGDAIMDGLKGINYDKVMTFIQTTFLGGLAIGIKKLLGGIGIDVTGGTIDICQGK